MAGGEWNSPAGAACVLDETDAQIYSLFKDHTAKNRNWNTRSGVCSHSPEEGHSGAGEIHSLAEDNLRITERKGVPEIFPSKALVLQMRKQRPRYKGAVSALPRDRAEAQLELRFCLPAWALPSMEHQLGCPRAQKAEQCQSHTTHLGCSP